MQGACTVFRGLQTLLLHQHASSSPLCCRGVYVSLNFCRKQAGIVDWAGWSRWRPNHSSTKRMVKLPKEKAQAAYNVLSALIHDKFSLRPEALKGEHQA